MNRVEDQNRNFSQAKVLVKRLLNTDFIFASYNLACLYALQKKPDKCRKVLEQMAAEDKLFLSDLVQEDDFKTVRHHESISTEKSLF